MTNFDVIEAYIEDFTKWAYRNSRGTAKITNNTIVITNVVETNNIVEDDNEPYPDMFKGVTIGNGKIRIGLPGINKDIVLDANDIETFKQSLVK